MSRFTGPLAIVFDEDDSCATLLEDLVWEVDEVGSGLTVTVPAGYYSDGATVPRFLWWFMPPWGDKSTRAAILHDWLLERLPHKPREYRIARRFADRQFYLALRALKVSRVRAWLALRGVRLYSHYEGWIGIYLKRKTV